MPPTTLPHPLMPKRWLQPRPGSRPPTGQSAKVPALPIGRNYSGLLSDIVEEAVDASCPQSGGRCQRRTVGTDRFKSRDACARCNGTALQLVWSSTMPGTG